MANKTQAKAAIDNVVAQIKADIDTILPTGVNIVDGDISFGPPRYIIFLDANGLVATANSWLTDIMTNLATASRTFTVGKFRRSVDEKEYVITEARLVIRIRNF